jgi:hypothetical protein
MTGKQKEQEILRFADIQAMHGFVTYKTDIIPVITIQGLPPPPACELHVFFVFNFKILWWVQNLNSGLYVCKASSLSLEPYLQYILL